MRQSIPVKPPGPGLRSIRLGRWKIDPSAIRTPPQPQHATAKGPPLDSSGILKWIILQKHMHALYYVVQVLNALYACGLLCGIIWGIRKGNILAFTICAALFSLWFVLMGWSSPG